MNRLACVFSTATDDYVPYAAVSLLTFKRYNSSFDMYLLCAHMSDMAQSLCTRCGIKVIPVDLTDAFYREWKYPRECFYHFYAPELFERLGYSYSVYIDGDTYCNRSFSLEGHASTAFDLAGVSYDTTGEFFQELGELDALRHQLNVDNDHALQRPRIQTGVLAYNNCQLARQKYFEKARDLYHISIERGLPRKGDDSLLALLVTKDQSIRVHPLSQSHNLIDFKLESLTPVPTPEEIITNAIVYHFVAQKPWLEGCDGMGYAHKYFASKWREVMINSFTQEEVKAWFPALHKDTVIDSGKAEFYWYSVSPPNFGDSITPYFLRKVCNRTVCKPVDPTITTSRVIISTGSIMRLCGPNTIVWGSGIRDRFQDIRPGLDVRSVRGPLTRARLLEVGGECPPVYGDPALLLPRFYRPTNVVKRYALGIVPHISQYERVCRAYENVDGTMVIDLRTTDVEKVIDSVISCEKIVSSSLHGIIAANAYGIPVRWIKFDTNVFGDDTKFYDHFAAIGRPRETYIDALYYLRIPAEELCEYVCQYEMTIDLDKLWEASVFCNGEVSRYVRYLMS
jgi:pyruvyltransferase